MAGMKELVEDIAKALVDSPNRSSVREVSGRAGHRCSNCGSRRAIWAR